MNHLPLQSTYETELSTIYCVENTDNLRLLSEIIGPHAETVAKMFYRVMLKNEFSVVFLTNEMVESRLTGSMTAWINELFVQHIAPVDIEKLIQRQVEVGHVHARIDLPMSLVNYGMRTLKSTMSTYILEAGLTAEQQGDLLILLNSIVDNMTALINDSYLTDLVISENTAQAFRLNVSSQSIAFDFERLRTSLLDWVRQVLTKLHEENVDRATIPTIRHSDFGLWITHKGALILTGKPELSLLMEFISDASELVDQLLDLEDRSQDSIRFNQLIETLNNHVTKVVWVLGDTAKEMLDIDSGRDSLTHLFNRRYLSTVLHHETEVSLKTGMRYGILYLDIDHFKVFNDTHGHENGDIILQQFVAKLSQSVRTGDFVFRYGGEEFLIVLADIEESLLPVIAEKVRLLLNNAEFKLINDDVITVTASIGAAIHDGHPDYQRTISNADKALYNAKENGRNRVEIFQRD